jgi:hypothetical protein
MLSEEFLRSMLLINGLDANNVEALEYLDMFVFSYPYALLSMDLVVVAALKKFLGT